MRPIPHIHSCSFQIFPQLRLTQAEASSLNSPGLAGTWQGPKFLDINLKWNRTYIQCYTPAGKWVGSGVRAGTQAHWRGCRSPQQRAKCPPWNNLNTLFLNNAMDFYGNMSAFWIYKNTLETDLKPLYQNLCKVLTIHLWILTVYCIFLDSFMVGLSYKPTQRSVIKCLFPWSNTSRLLLFSSIFPRFSIWQSSLQTRK